MQGADAKAVESLAQGDIDHSGLDEAERALLEFVAKVTRHAYRITNEDTQRLRALGFTDEQLGEAVYVAALFAFFNRVADAFGLADPGYRDMADSGTLPPPPAQHHR